MPYTSASDVSYDMWGDNKGNQAQPLLISTTGRFVWSEEPMAFSFREGVLRATVRDGEIVSGDAGETLADAYRHAAQTFFPTDGRIPDPSMFLRPQYNTWIELMYDQNEEDILAYAEAIVANGFPPGVLMIDDNWQEDYGVWEFSAKRFTDPKGMVKRLHELGFKVMLWICPFVSPDSAVFRDIGDRGLLIGDVDRMEEVSWGGSSNKAAIIRWWNGASACLDLSNPDAMEWFRGELDHLVDAYGVDGFKFDAGDASFYKGNIASRKADTPNDHTRYFAELGLSFPLNEYRASWKMAGLPLAQRLRDKAHQWEDLQKLIPDLMAQSLMGYAYTCPDMIGGGDYASFVNSASIDEELIVRSAQVHALMPMMQFSVAPWRVLSDKNVEICRRAARLHASFGERIVKLAEESSRTGMPVVRPMELVFPGQGFEKVRDQFMLGDEILVAPVVEKGKREREVVLPQGNWRADDGEVFVGGTTVRIPVPLARLPYFLKL